MQQGLKERFRIEIPVPEHNGQFLLRVSCHLYNTLADIDYLIQSLSQLGY